MQALLLPGPLLGALLTALCLLWALWVGALFAFRRRADLKTGAVRDCLFPGLVLLIAVTWAMVDPNGALGRFLDIYARFGLIVLAFMTLTWCISLMMRDSSIMDIVYPLTALLPLAILLSQRNTWSPHELVLLGLVALWSLRLSVHIAWRNLGHGEDARYAGWRRRFGALWWWWSYFQVFALQGVLVWLWCLPIALALHASPRGFGWQHLLAGTVFIVGFVFQAGGDWQLERFKRMRRDRAEVLTTGLWSVTRHPNYFGEAVMWWSFWILSLVHPWGWASVAAPLYVTWFMAKGSATPMQDRYLTKTKPGYAAYAERVPTFFPWSRTGA